ncbi:hypothetical protein ELQ35_03695 [Peribacillus cavernae]|uniref:SWIM-type domain-containing protein n=1 Tax=Peribacillus cavernae TaxID=1674310 RepID=A0A433HT17_9BACI|nr:SWIM zinc finger family protein [Peribacillus cavernae]MDQ0218464.1 hypothetical protein [Peribacillus cavernae]RUQ31462.1 hypothetical protein ELQ35_03695 [Peribacillus cavernae]
MSNELIFFSEQLNKMLDPNVKEELESVQKGLMLYRQELVYQKHETEKRITATVQDVVPVQVELDLLAVAFSTCGCKEDFFCRHRMAVFFSSYADVASVIEWVQNWRKKRPVVETPPPIMLANDLLKAKTNTVLEKDYSAWKTFFTSAYEEVIEANLHLPPYLVNEKIRLYLQKVRSKSPLEREWKNLYSFVADFTSLLLTMRMIREDKMKSEVIRFFHSLANDLAEELHTSVQHLSRQARPFAFDPFLEGIREDVTDLLDGMDVLKYEKIDVYRAIWSFLLTNPVWRRHELERVQEKLASATLQPAEESSYQIADIHLLILTNHDGEAAALLNRLDINVIPYLFYWLKMFSDHDMDNRAAPYIDFLNRKVRSFLKDLSSYYQASDFVRTFSGPVGRYCYKMNRMDVLERFYRECMPYSYWNYANFLFEQEQYKKWVEMHIYTDISIDVIGTENLKRVAAQDPALVLPLYYHAVQQTISLKNRSAYKQAVRYLKKMRTLYKKMKKEDVFLEYMKYVTESTKRLRAFQEELQRGKLIDAK